MMGDIYIDVDRHLNTALPQGLFKETKNDTDEIPDYGRHLVGLLCPSIGLQSAARMSVRLVQVRDAKVAPSVKIRCGELPSSALDVRREATVRRKSSLYMRASWSSMRRL